jgi:hypothetical protein
MRNQLNNNNNNSNSSSSSSASGSSTELDNSPAVIAPAAESWTEDDELVGAVPGWGGQLLTSARFAHSHAYIAALAAHCGFEIVSVRSLPLRLEGTVQLNGLFYLLKLA